MIKMKLFRRLIFMVILGSSVITLRAWAQTEETEVVEMPKDGKILDFEAEVIEGQRKAPQLFLQMDVGTPDLDSVMYLRQNFNDFHAVEKNRKPLYRRKGR